MMLRYKQDFFEVYSKHLDKCDVFVGMKSLSKEGELWELKGWKWGQHIKEQCPIVVKNDYGTPGEFFQVQFMEDPTYFRIMLNS